MDSKKIMFDHYILTRFNVNWKKNKRLDKNGKPVNDSNWLSHRVSLFEKYCLPSLLNQSCQDYKWIIMFDKDTDSSLLHRYSHIDNIIIAIYEGSDTFKRHIITDKPFVITSRLDNDDAYEVGFVNAIQESFRGVEEILDVAGRQYSTNHMEYYRVTNNNLSPFITLVEKNKAELNTVLMDTHGNMGKHYPSRKIDKMLYTQIIHDSNLLNRETKVKWTA